MLFIYQPSLLHLQRQIKLYVFTYYYIQHICYNLCIFDFLKQNYKKFLSKKTCFTIYHINKVNFILLIEKTRWQGIISQNIELT